jgi:hypothetical protein
MSEKLADFITCEVASSFFGLSRKTLSAYVRSGKIKGIKENGYTLINSKSLRAYIERQKNSISAQDLAILKKTEFCHCCGERCNLEDFALPFTEKKKTEKGNQWVNVVYCRSCYDETFSAA